MKPRLSRDDQDVVFFGSIFETLSFAIFNENGVICDSSESFQNAFGNINNVRDLVCCDTGRSG